MLGNTGILLYEPVRLWLGGQEVELHKCQFHPLIPSRGISALNTNDHTVKTKICLQYNNLFPLISYTSQQAPLLSPLMRLTYPDLNLHF